MPEQPLTAYAKGVMGEAAASACLSRQGMLILESRYRSPYGEIDLILLDGETLVFAEVKTREASGRAEAQQAVTPGKQRRLINTARCYLGFHPEHAQRILRFDVVTVTQSGVDHIPNAFQGNEW